MDARGFFANTRSVYRQNDFGFTAAGPVWLPKALRRPQQDILLRLL